jgi:hypothetical protein
MLAGIGRSLVNRLAQVDAVVQQLVQVALVDRLAALGGDTLGTQVARQQGGRADHQEALEE